MNGVNFNSCCYVKTGLLKTEAHATGPGKKVDSYRPVHLALQNKR